MATFISPHRDSQIGEAQATHEHINIYEEYKNVWRSFAGRSVPRLEKLTTISSPVWMGRMPRADILIDTVL